MGASARIGVCALLLSGCQRAYVCPGDPELGVDPANLTMASPAAGSHHAGPWVPVVVRTDASDDDSRVTTCLDGQPADDPLGLVRMRRSGMGGGWDYLGYLDLVDVEPGRHDLLVVFDRPGGARAAARASFTVERGAHRLTVDVVDGDGAPASARILVTDAEDEPVPLVDLPTDADPSLRDTTVSSLFALDGRAEVWLDEGTWRLRAVRSVLDTAPLAEVALSEDTGITLQVERVVDLPDHLAADLHVHTGQSYDAFVPDRLRVASLVAAGLDVAVVTDHNDVVDPAPAIEALGAEGVLRGVPGVEQDIRKPGGTDQPAWDWGHMNAFPVVGRDEAPLPAKEVAIIGTAVGAMRSRAEDHPFPGTGGEILVQINHPRGIHFFPDQLPNREAWPLFEELGFDHDAPVGEGANAWMTAADPATGATFLDFDAIEVVNRFSWPLYLDVRSDWFTLLDNGVWMTGTGNSDSHALQVEVAGFPVNLVRAPRPAAGEDLDHDGFVAALRRGEVLVSNGPVVELILEAGGRRAGPGQDLSAGGTATATVHVRAAPWVPVPEARLVVGGEVVEVWDVPAPAADAALDVTFTAEVTLSADTWVLAEAGWALGQPPTPIPRRSEYALLAPGYLPMAFTNPVRVDADADGTWAPQGAPR